MSLIGILFYAFLALIAVASALAMLLDRSAIHSALFLVLNFATVAVLYLALGAPFIAFTQVSVYAGAIMVLFLFVIAMLGAEKLTGQEPIKSHRPLALILAAIFIVEIVLFTIFRNQGIEPMILLTQDFASPKNIGVTMLTQYALPFEVVAFILLSAAVGAIMLTKPERNPALKLSQGKK
jgi:NADH-quinone oxidoreductase subunit J